MRHLLFCVIFLFSGLFLYAQDDWVVYASKHKFQVKYPANYVLSNGNIEELESINISKIDLPDFYLSHGKNDGADKIADLRITVNIRYLNPDNQDQKDYLHDLPILFKRYYLSTLRIDDITANAFYINRKDINMIYVYFIKGNKIVTFKAYPGDSKLRDEFFSIIKTFKIE